MANVFFDFDGVLVRSRLPNGSFLWKEKLETDLGISSDIQAKIFERPHWIEIIMGRAAFRPHLAKIFNTYRLNLDPEVFVEYWLQRDLNWYKEVLDLAEGLKDSGHDLYIATNQDQIRGQHIRRQVEVQRLFQAVFTSADIGVAKPDDAYFRDIARRFDDDSSKVFLVIDDDIRNIKAAESIGWRGCHFDPDLDPESSIARLRKALGKHLGVEL
jgi:putative hydrolase of the HAD superfamily